MAELGGAEARVLIGETELRQPVTVVNTVTIGAALPAGNNKIGAVDIASPLPAGNNNIGDVDVVSMPPQSSAVSPADQTTTDTYVEVTGSTLDTAAFGQVFIGYRLAEVGGTNGVTYKVQGSLDTATWTDLTTLDEDGVERAGAEIAVPAAGDALAFITPGYDAGAKAAFRSYRVVVRSTTAGAAGTARVRGFAK
jgi:hypothetical protein